MNICGIRKSKKPAISTVESCRVFEVKRIWLLLGFIGLVVCRLCPTRHSSPFSLGGMLFACSYSTVFIFILSNAKKRVFCQPFGSKRCQIPHLAARTGRATTCKNGSLPQLSRLRHLLAENFSVSVTRAPWNNSSAP